MSTNPNIEESLIRDYEAIKVDLKKFGRFVDGILKEYCNSLPARERVQIGPKYRIKENYSLKDKAFNREKIYGEPLLEIQDKVGTRLVLLTMNEVDFISTLIKNERRWAFVDKSQEISRIRLKEAERFTYQSEHFIVKPRRKYFRPVSAKIDYLTCEIQVRTLMQHAYSEVSHDTVYKGDYSNNKPMIRALATSMALIETSDEKFKEVYKIMSSDKSLNNKFISTSIKVFQEIQPSFKKGDFDTRSIHSVLNFLDKNIQADDDYFKEFESFVEENKRLYKKIITEKKAVLFSNPAIILVLFVLRHNYSTFKDNWPYSSFALEESKRYLGL